MVRVRVDVRMFVFYVGVLAEMGIYRAFTQSQPTPERNVVLPKAFCVNQVDLCVGVVCVH